MRGMRETKNSGQIIIIAAFVIATLLLSAELYVFNVAKTTNEIKFNSLNDFALAVKLGSQHVVVSSLANSTNGGTNNILMSNLESWASFVSSEYDFGKSILNCTAGDTAPYSSGLWINWGSNGYGVSSAYAEFTYTLQIKEQASLCRTL